LVGEWGRGIIEVEVGAMTTNEAELRERRVHDSRRSAISGDMCSRTCS
jgi:hypothetical protein